MVGVLGEPLDHKSKSFRRKLHRAGLDESAPVVRPCASYRGCCSIRHTAPKDKERSPEEHLNEGGDSTARRRRGGRRTSNLAAIFDEVIYSPRTVPAGLSID